MYGILIFDIPILAECAIKYLIYITNKIIFYNRKNSNQNRHKPCSLLLICKKKLRRRGK